MGNKLKYINMSMLNSPQNLPSQVVIYYKWIWFYTIIVFGCPLMLKWSDRGMEWEREMGRAGEVSVILREEEKEAKKEGREANQWQLHERKQWPKISR